MKSWQIQEAKARLSEVVKFSLAQGPQEITVHGKPAAVIVSKDDFDRLTSHKPSFIDFLRKSPLVGVPLQIRRDRTPVRNVAL